MGGATPQLTFFFVFSPGFSIFQIGSKPKQHVKFEAVFWCFMLCRPILFIVDVWICGQKIWDVRNP